MKDAAGKLNNFGRAKPAGTGTLMPGSMARAVLGILLGIMLGTVLGIMLGTVLGVLSGLWTGAPGETLSSGQDAFALTGVEPVYAAEGYEDVATASEMASALTIGKYGMVPIYSRDIKPGTYNVTTECSSSFFTIVKTTLKVGKAGNGKGGEKSDGKMTADIHIASKSYECVYMGSATEAAKAPKSDYIMADTSGTGSTFRIPVEALNKELKLAAFSVNRKKWYDRLILVDASTLPGSAVSFQVPDYSRVENAIELYDEENGTNTKGEMEKRAAEQQAKENSKKGDSGETDGATKPASISMKDGTYSIEVNMTGGSGRASVSSPTWFIVKSGKAYARLLWSSSHYDYMMVGGKKYLNESKDGGNSTFTIPITQFDTPISVIGDTTAMGSPVAIAYKLTFYRDSITSRNKIPQEAAKQVLIIAFIVMAVGGVLNYVVKKRAQG